MSEINFKTTFTTLSQHRGKLCTHQCECVGTKNSSFTEEQISLNLRIVLFGFDWYLRLAMWPTGLLFYYRSIVPYGKHIAFKKKREPLFLSKLKRIDLKICKFIIKSAQKILSLSRVHGHFLNNIMHIL